MNREARKKKLLLYMERSESINYNEELTNREDLFIVWFQIRKICLALKADPQESDEDKRLASTLLLKFDKGILPKLTNFKKEVEKLPFSERLTHFYRRINVFTTKAEPLIAMIPISAYEIYEDTLQFINLYRFAFPIPEYYSNARKNIMDHLSMLKEAFEVEAGKKDLEERDKILSDKIQPSKESTEPNKREIEESKSTESIKEEELAIEALNLPESIETSENKKNTDLPSISEVYSSVLQPNAPNFSNTLPDIPDNEKRISIASLKRQEVPLQPILPSRPAPSKYPNNIIDQQLKSIEISSSEAERHSNNSHFDIYHYQKWFPAAVWSSFGALRYCNKCGRVRDPNTGICRGCGSQFNRIYI